MNNNNNNDNNNEINKATLETSDTTTEPKPEHQEKKRKIDEIFKEINDKHDERFGTPTDIPNRASKKNNIEEDTKGNKEDQDKFLSYGSIQEDYIRRSKEAKYTEEKEKLLSLAEYPFGSPFEKRDIVKLFKSTLVNKEKTSRSVEEKALYLKKIKEIEAKEKGRIIDLIENANSPRESEGYLSSEDLLEIINDFITKGNNLPHSEIIKPDPYLNKESWFKRDLGKGEDWLKESFKAEIYLKWKSREKSLNTSWNCIFRELHWEEDEARTASLLDEREQTIADLINTIREDNNIDNFDLLLRLIWEYLKPGDKHQNHRKPKPGFFKSQEHLALEEALIKALDPETLEDTDIKEALTFDPSEPHCSKATEDKLIKLSKATNKFRLESVPNDSDWKLLRLYYIYPLHKVLSFFKKRVKEITKKFNKKYSGLAPWKYHVWVYTYIKFTGEIKAIEEFIENYRV